MNKPHDLEERLIDFAGNFVGIFVVSLVGVPASLQRIFDKAYDKGGSKSLLPERQSFRLQFRHPGPFLGRRYALPQATVTRGRWPVQAPSLHPVPPASVLDGGCSSS